MAYALSGLGKLREDAPVVGVLARPVRIGVIDDQPSFRDAVRGIVDHHACLTWAGSAEGGDGLGDLLAADDVDLLLLDVNLPGRDGIQLADELRQRGSGPIVVLCSTYDVCDLREQVRTCGARAYLRKEDLSASVLLDVWEHHAAPVEYLDGSAQG